MMKKVFALFLVAILAISLVGCKTTDENPEYPTKPISLYVGAKAGGGTDVLARLIAPELEKQLGQSIAIINKEGGAGTLGNLEVANAQPDGYTIGFLTDFETIGNMLSGTNLGYTKDDIRFVGSINASTNVLILGADFPGEKTLKGFIEYCEKNPGKATIATASAAQRMVLQSLADSAKVEFTAVPFTSGANSFNALLGGQVDACFISPTFDKQAKENGCTTVAAASYERFSLLPEVPTFKECGYETINNEVTRIMFVPKDTPDYIVEILEKALKNATDNDEFKEAFEKTKEMYSYKNAEEATASFNQKYDAIKKVVEANPGILG